MYLASLALISILLLWTCSILTYIDRIIYAKQMLSFMNDSLVFFSCIVFMVAMYLLLKKHFVTLEDAENAINDPEKQVWIDNTKWTFWILIIIPLLTLFLAGPK
jgi:hypothetical protein